MKKVEMAAAVVFAALCIFLGSYGVMAMTQKFFVPSPAVAASASDDTIRLEIVLSLKEEWKKLQEPDIAAVGVCASLVKWHKARAFGDMILKYPLEPADNFDFQSTDLMAVEYQIAKALVASVIDSKGLIDCGDGLSGVSVVESAVEAAEDNGIVFDGTESTSMALRQALIRQVKPALANPKKEIVTGRTVADVVRQYGLTAAELKR